ncbi:MAG: serine/threonine protein kinase [Myxococcales bacterium]|nr:serine/threonine protein kinase [Myxococcales bacterium]
MQLQQDLLFCRQCRRHFRGRRRSCPSDGGPLELVGPFEGRPGDVLDDRYELDAQIGTGGMGTVFRATDRVANRSVALKLLRHEYACNAASAQRFFQEARLLRQVSHPSVVGLHRFARTRDGVLLIDMELLDGESLRDRVLRQGHGVDLATGLLILDNLLAALTACHESGVVHCDVKPENLILPRIGSVGQCKLVDFGIAQAPGPVHQTEDVGVVGTPAYMSPEQVRAQNVDNRTDLYLVGCVVYELLTGEPPFSGTTPLDLCHHQMLTAPPSLQARLPDVDLPAGFDMWLAPLLEKDITLRPTSTRDVRDHLRTIRLQWMRNQATAQRDQRQSLRPPSATILRRPVPAAEPVRAPREPVPALAAVRALIEVRQMASGVVFGPQAIEQLVRHVLAGSLQDLRHAGAVVGGPAGPHIDIKLDCDGDPRGAVGLLLDAVASMNEQLGRIPEPKLEVRAALVADNAPWGGVAQGLDPLQLLGVSPASPIRVDEHVARWAGRRALVRLTALPSPSRTAPTSVYAASLHSS